MTGPIKKKLKRISHATLVRSGPESAYRSKCPVCEKGTLLVRRDPSSLAIINHDSCTMCGQEFVYTDKFIAGEPVADVFGKKN